MQRQIETITQTRSEMAVGFPDDIRILSKGITRREHNDFVSDVAYYTSIIREYAKNADRAPSWDTPVRHLARHDLEKSFSEWHPEYLHLLDRMTAESTPDLHDQMTTCENLRVKLLELLDLLDQDQAESAGE